MLGTSSSGGRLLLWRWWGGGEEAGEQLLVACEKLHFSLSLYMAQQDRSTVTGSEFPCPWHISLKDQTGLGDDQLCSDLSHVTWKR